MGALLDALVEDLARFDAEVRTATRAEQVSHDGDGWRVTTRSAPEVPSGDAGEESETADRVEELDADAVIVATDEGTARVLLADAVPALAASAADAATVAPEIEVVTLLLDAPALDAAPRGTGVLTVPGSHIAKALTHSTAKWDWVREAAGGRHVVRVSFGAQGEPAATAELDDDAAAQLALSEASALLGVPLAPPALIAAHRARYVQAQPASIIGAGERRDAARAAVQAVPGLATVGAWLAGTGLAQVLPDAKAESDRLRHALLFE